ncbi:MAG: enoyl-CoA hydratase/isomerase family protein [Polyangiaceae bacterium]
MSAEGEVVATLSAEGHVLDLEFFREKGNVLTGALMRQLDAVLVEHASRTDLRMVALRGRGKHFSFGASVEEHRKADAPAMLGAFHALCRRVASYPVPVVAAVQGRCLGGAFELALCAHFVLAEPTAVFACPEIKLGVFPPVLAALGPTRLGSALTDQLLLTGAELNGQRAKEIGFVFESFEGDAKAASEDFYGRMLAALSAASLRQGVRVVRRAVVEAMDRPLAEAERQYVEELLETHDANEGIEAFIARRPVQWQHR